MELQPDKRVPKGLIYLGIIMVVGFVVYSLTAYPIKFDSTVQPSTSIEEISVGKYDGTYTYQENEGLYRLVIEVTIHGNKWESVVKKIVTIGRGDAVVDKNHGWIRDEHLWECQDCDLASYRFGAMIGTNKIDLFNLTENRNFIVTKDLSEDSVTMVHDTTATKNYGRDSSVKSPPSIGSDNDIYGTWEGQQDAYPVKNSSGEDIVVNGQTVMTPVCHWKFILSEDGTANLEQTDLENHTTAYYNGTGGDDANISNGVTLLHYTISSSDHASSFRLTLRLTQNKEGLCFPDSNNGPDFSIIKKQ